MKTRRKVRLPLPTKPPKVERQKKGKGSYERRKALEERARIIFDIDHMSMNDD